MLNLNAEKSAQANKDRKRYTTVRIRIIIETGIAFSSTIFVVVATSAFDLDDVENH
jgi:hypothetical protein